MKKFISTIVLMSLILQIILPEISLAIEISENNSKVSENIIIKESDDINSETKNLEEGKEINNEIKSQESKQDTNSENTINKNEYQEESKKEDDKTELIESNDENEKNQISFIPKDEILVSSGNSGLTFGKTITKWLENNGYDTNNDGKFSESEIDAIYDTYIDLYCEDGKIDFIGIEYLSSIEQIYINNIDGSIDFSKLKNVTNIKRLSMSGKINDLTSVEGLCNIEELYIDFYENSSIGNVISKITTLNNLKNLSLNANNLENLQGLENISNLKNLELNSYEHKLDGETLQKMNNIQRLILYNVTNKLDWINNFTNLLNLEIYIDEQDEELINYYKIANIENIKINGEYVKIKGKSKDTSIEFDEKLKQALINNGYDLNGDEKFSLEELAYNNWYLYVDCNNEQIDLTGIEYVINLHSLALSNAVGNVNLEKLQQNSELEELELYGDIDDLVGLEKIPNLKRINIDSSGDKNIGIFLNSMKNLNKIEELSLYSGNNNEEIDFTPISNLKTLKTLELRWLNVQNLSGIENLNSLTNLYIEKDMNSEIDKETLVKLSNLKELEISNLGEDIQWIKSFNSLEKLTLDNYSNVGLSEEYIEVLISLEVKKIVLSGQVNIDLGNLKEEEQNVISFEEHPLLKSVINENSPLYNNNFNIEQSQENYYSNEILNENNFKIENNNIYITPNSDTRRYEYIKVNDNLIAKIEWQFESDNEELVFSQMLREKLKEYNVDENNDGKITKKELQKVKIEYLGIYTNNNEQIDLTGIENLKDLQTLYLNVINENIDLSILKQNETLKNLTLHGSLNNLSTLKELKQIQRLELNTNSSNSNIDFNSIKSLDNLEFLEIGGYINNINFSEIKNLKNLKELSIYPYYYINETIDFQSLSELNNIEKLTLNNINLESLNGLEKLTSIKTLALKIDFDKKVKVDGKTLAKMDNIQNLTLYNINEDIDWIKNLKNLKQLNLTIYDKVISQDFIDTLNNSKIENISLNGDIEVDVGELKENEKNEITFSSIPILKALTDNTNRLYNNGYNLSKVNWSSSEDTGFENKDNFTIDTKNKKIIITPKDENRRREKIYVKEDLTVTINWTIPIDNEEVAFGEKIKKDLINYGFDKNSDGIITRKELKQNTKRYMYLYFNQNEEEDLTGIENLTELNELTIRINKNTDLTCLQNLPELSRLDISASEKVTDLSSLKNVTRNKRIKHKLKF